jgi:hypothetical protein
MPLTKLTVIMPDPNSTPERRRAVRRLKGIEPVKVDLVDRAANKRRFLVFKEDTMPEQTAGPELTPVGDELHNPEAVSELERAASALESLTAAVEQLQKSLVKADPAPAAEATTGEAGEMPDEPPADYAAKGNGAASAALREVSERAASLAAALDEAPEMDAEKLNKDVADLVGVLQGIIEKYPSPTMQQTEAKEAAMAPEPDKEPACKAEVALTALADQANALVAELTKSLMLNDETDSALAQLIAAVDALAGELAIEKSAVEPVMPEIFKAEESEMSALAQAMVQVLTDVAQRATTVAKTCDQAELPQAVKDEINAIGAILVKAKEVVPTKAFEALKQFAKALQESTGRVAELTAKADEAGFSDEQARAQLQQAAEILISLSEKFGEVKKSVAYEASDLGKVLSADRLLTQFEAELLKFGLISQPSETAGAPAEPETASAQPDTSEQIADLTAKLQALSAQVGVMQSSVAKARDIVPAAASVVPEVSGAAVSLLLFPMDYNDPAYLEEVQKSEEGA